MNSTIGNSGITTATSPALGITMQVCIPHGETFVDLNLEQAKQLKVVLEMAIYEQEQLDAMCEEHDRQMENENETTN